MSDISTGMKVTGLSQYKSAMQQAQQSVKTLDAQLKKTEAQYKATGDKEQYMSDRANILRQRLTAQTNAAKQAQNALEHMRSQGVDPSSASFQRMQQQLLKAQTGVLQTTAELNNLNTSEQEAAKSADQLTTSVNGISKKISLDQVISGVNAITNGLETAAKKAIQLGQELWSAVMDSAKWADDTATQAMMYDMTTDEYQRVAKVAATWGETSVEAIMSARQRIRRNISLMSKDTAEALEQLGVNPYAEGVAGKFGSEQMMKDWQDMFWEIGDALMNMGDQYNRAEIAQSLFGRKYEELVPMWKMGREAYEQALEDQTVVSEDTIKDLATMNDTITQLTQNFETLKTETIGAHAPALTGAADALSGLLEKVLEYLDTEEGQQMLDDLAASVSGLFEDLGKIDPESVVEGFTSVFNTIVDGFKWLVDNKDGIIQALEGVVIGWGALKLTGGALELYKLIQGITGLAGGAAAAAQAGTAAGASWGAAFAKSAMAAAPWLAGLITLLTPAKGGNDDLIDSNGRLTETAKGLGYTLDNNGQIVTNRKPGRFELTLDEIVANASEGTKKQPITIDLTYGNKPVSTMGSAGQTMALLDIFTGGKQEVDVPVVPETPDDAAEQIAAQIGTVQIGARIVPISLGGGPGGSGRGVVAQFHANGLPFVPFDGYPAILHKGERVMTANENRSYTYNTYFGNVNLNNGLEVEQLAESIEKRNKRQRNGYGS